MIRIGFRFRETMAGSFYTLAVPTDEREMSFSITAHAETIRGFMRDQKAQIEGVISAEGFCDHRPLRGTVTIRPFKERRLSYDFFFGADDGQKYHFVGEKDIVPVAPIHSMTVLPAHIYDATDEEVARATVRFDLRNDLWSFLRSYRLTY